MRNIFCCVALTYSYPYKKTMWKKLQEPLSKADFEQAADFLREKKLVVFPTETVYGLGADAESDEAVSAIYKVKGRPHHNPLIVHVENSAVAARYGILNPLALRLATVFWPGPFTIVVESAPGCPLSTLVSAEGATVAMRMPRHPVALALLKAFGKGIAAPSANRSGHVSPTTIMHVEGEFFPPPIEMGMLIDGGACDVGIESTVVDCTGEEPVILRPGSVTKEMLEAALCKNLTAAPGASTTLKSPGLLESHYAPSLPVRLNAAAPEPDEAWLAFGKTTGHAPDFNLSEEGSLEEAAHHLFAALRLLDRAPYRGIAVMPIPLTGIGIAINDRLQRAAAKKG